VLAGQRALEGLQIHHQMALKAASLLSYRGLFSAATVGHIFRRSFPQLAASFNSSMEVLLRRGLVRPAGSADVAQLLLAGIAGGAGRDDLDWVGEPEPAPWRWAGGRLRREVYGLLLGFDADDDSDDPAAATGGAGRAEDASQGALTAAAQRQLDALPAEQRPVFMLADTGLAERLAAGLLGTHRRMWYRLAAEYFEGQQAGRGRAAGLVLAHHWAEADHSAAGAEAGAPPDPVVSSGAARHLYRAACVAAAHSAPLPALEMLQWAGSLLDQCEGGVPEQRRTMLLFAAAPCALLVHGPGSDEAIAAYSALLGLVPDDGPLDTVGSAALAGSCANLCATGRDFAGAQVLPHTHTHNPAAFSANISVMAVIAREAGACGLRSRWCGVEHFQSNVKQINRTADFSKASRNP
jgi:hypothetical protein